MLKDISKPGALLNQEKDHRICYLVPNELDPTKYTIAEPTPFVKQWLARPRVRLGWVMKSPSDA
jgi:hypothetical protein